MGRLAQSSSPVAVSSFVAVVLATLAVSGAWGSDTGAEPPAPVEPFPISEPVVYEEEEAGDVIRYEGDRLTIDVVDMSLRALLLEVGRVSGARVRIDGLEDRTVSDAFTRLPLDHGLRRLLGNRSFTVTFANERSADGKVIGARPKELRIYGGEGTSVTRSSSARAKRRTSGPTAAGLQTTRGARKPAKGADAKDAAATETAKEKTKARLAKKTEDADADRDAQDTRGEQDEPEAPRRSRLTRAVPEEIDRPEFLSPSGDALRAPVTAASLGRFVDEVENGWVEDEEDEVVDDAYDDDAFEGPLPYEDYIDDEPEFVD